MFINNVPVIQITELPRLLICRHDGRRPSQSVLKFFGDKSRIVDLYNTWSLDNLWIESTQTVCGHTDWVIISLGLYYLEGEEGKIHEPSLDEEIKKWEERLQKIVDQEIDGKPALVPCQ